MLAGLRGVKSLKELIRVTAKELRVFPLVGLDARKYPYLDRVIEEIEGGNLTIEVIKTPFEFQKGADEILKISK